jgi:SAM-dependent methyltransferase
MAAVFALASAPEARYVPFRDAQAIVGAMREALPSGLQGKSPEEIAAAWPEWVRQRDAEVRARLDRGDEDSLANLLLYGSAFTNQPRLTPEYMQQVQREQPKKGDSPEDPQNDALVRVFVKRVEDLARALASPGDNERLQYMREVVMRRGLAADTEAGRRKLEQFLMANLARVREEHKRYTEELRQARRRGDATEEFAQRSRLFRDRGIAVDTSLLPNYALEKSLAEMRKRGLLKPSGVRRVAIVGPGLDFVDKDEGHDFYPQQSIQPFAVMDSLVRLGLARPTLLEVTTFDISQRVNEHLARAREQAARGIGYVVQLPRDPHEDWAPDALRYWRTVGTASGQPANPVAPPTSAGDVRVRAVRIRPEFVLRLRPLDMNIVYQRLELPVEERFDLIIATNILVYYDTFEQSLALANLERMLKPGGFLLTNDLLLELPALRMRSVDYVSVPYSGRAQHGDRIVWYRNTAAAASTGGRPD